MKFSTKRLNIREITQKEENMRYVSNGKFDWTESEFISKYENKNKDYEKRVGGVLL